ncbi:hypothetical protein Peur_002780 [Populus x canadensis]
MKLPNWSHVRYTLYYSVNRGSSTVLTCAKRNSSMPTFPALSFPAPANMPSPLPLMAFMSLYDISCPGLFKLITPGGQLNYDDDNIKKKPPLYCQQLKNHMNQQNIFDEKYTCLFHDFIIFLILFLLLCN